MSNREKESLLESDYKSKLNKMGVSLDRTDHPLNYYKEMYFEKSNAKNKVSFSFSFILSFLWFSNASPKTLWYPLSRYSAVWFIIKWIEIIILFHTIPFVFKTSVVYYFESG